jgi:CMP-2-keto-3-deoxyoctulosonic acid synthetase
MFCAFCVLLCAFCGEIGIGFAEHNIMVQIIAIIPARMGSSRFPGKPLARILGRPMIEHVFRRAAMCDLLDAVYVATCDEDIRASPKDSARQSL